VTTFNPRSAGPITAVATDELAQVRSDPRFSGALGVGSASDEWRKSAACWHADPEIFFPTVPDTSDLAVRICRTCPVQAPCLARALAAGECDGVWGATTPAERRVMRRAWDRLAAARSG
jgi:WhiB family transcriptional regulator, redox-sensing transcriptional regulator